MYLNDQARRLLSERYLLPGETFAGLFDRVSSAVSGEKASIFRKMMKKLEFLPNSPTLMNAGTPSGQLSACFVLPTGRVREEIQRTLGVMRDIHRTGGGTGFSFSALPAAAPHLSGRGIPDPLSALCLFNSATLARPPDRIRRGANMAVLSADHVDIFDFISSKKEHDLSSFALSVGISDFFFDAWEKGRVFFLSDPGGNIREREISPDTLWSAVCHGAWERGDPGVIFPDEINRKNTVPGLGRIEAVNPCGEQPLLPCESCTLGSINLSKCIRKGDLDDDHLILVTEKAVDFLDLVIDASVYPSSKIRETTRATRKIGLGVMGFAEMLILLGVPYESEEALRWAGRVMGLIQGEARVRSAELGAEKGSFPEIEKSIFSGEMRNATVTTVAPTGSLHIIAGTTAGIEPLYSLSFTRSFWDRDFVSVNPHILSLIRGMEGPDHLVNEIMRSGTISHMALDDELKDIYRTATEIAPSHHVKMQAAFQEFCDNAVSKTVNLPADATPGDIGEIFSLAHREGCKGISVFREGCRKDQPFCPGCRKMNLS